LNVVFKMVGGSGLNNLSKKLIEKPLSGGSVLNICFVRIETGHGVPDQDDLEVSLAGFVYGSSGTIGVKKPTSGLIRIPVLV